MKIIIKELLDSLEIQAAYDTVEDAKKVHGNIIYVDNSMNFGNKYYLVIDLPDAINIAHSMESDLISRITPFQCQLIFSIGIIYACNYRVQQLLNGIDKNKS